MGYGTHASASVAIVRAVTECAQSRITLIHGAREDLYFPKYHFDDLVNMYRSSINDLTEAVANKFIDSPWEDYPHQRNMSITCPTFGLLVQAICEQLATKGHNQIFCSELTKPGMPVNIVKVLVPSLHSTK
jgi:ribosomal protein S12 methylthiotransferase accessory factor